MALIDPEAWADCDTEENPDGCRICAGLIYPIGREGCEDSTSAEWSVLAGPAASDVVFTNRSTAASSASFPNPGRYTIQRCCYYNEGGAIDDGFPKFYNCPQSVMDGETFELTLINCPGPITWETLGVAANVVSASGNTATIQTLADGTMEVVARCDNGNIIEVYRCRVFVHETTQQFRTDYSPSYEQDVYLCDIDCHCEEEDVIVEACGEQDCIILKTGLTFKACPPEREIEPVTPRVEKAIIGTVERQKRACSDAIVKPCEDDICCDPHRAAILWNDVMNCGWTITATSEINGTVVQSAAACNIGKKWCFNGPVTITMQGPSAFVDTIVLYGHSMTDATVYTEPYQIFGDVDPRIDAYLDDACMEGHTRPLILYWNEVNDSITSLTITIDTVGEHCIEHVFAGQKLFIPPMPDEWVNPMNGSDRTVDVRTGDCGPVSVTSSRRMINATFPIECEDNDTYVIKYRPLLRYLACGNPLMFAWSFNNYPEDLFYGWLNDFDGTPYVDGMFPQLNLSATGFISQQQPKDFV